MIRVGGPPSPLRGYGETTFRRCDRERKVGGVDGARTRGLRRDSQCSARLNQLNQRVFYCRGEARVASFATHGSADPGSNSVWFTSFKSLMLND